MTSKTLWSNLQKIECRHRLSMYICWFVAMLFLPVTLLMTIDGMELNGYMIREELAENLAMYLDNGGLGANGVMAVTLGLATAFFCYYYVFGRPMLDLYHSIPVRREKLFFIKYLSGLVPSVLFLLVSTLLSFATLAVKGYLAPVVLHSFWIAATKNLVAFVIAFNLAIIAIMLTGNLVCAVLGSAVLSLFATFATELVELYHSNCFQTYWELGGTDTLLYMLFNPFSLAGFDTETDRIVLRFILLLLEAAVFGAIGLLLYLKRPSESVGKAVCYKIAKPFIRIPLVIMAALGGGLYVAFMFNSLPAIWYWAAFLLIGLLAHVILEIFLEQDARGIYRHPIQLVASLAVAAVIAVIFQYDLLGYDRYLPKEADIQSVSVRLSGIESELAHFEPNEKGEWDYADYEAILDDVQIADHAAVMDLAGAGIAALDPERSAIARRQNSMQNVDVPEKEPLYYVIKYTLRSGREVYRSYTADFDGLYDASERIYEDPAYRDYLYQIDDFVNEDLLGIISARTWDDMQAFDNSQIDVKAFLKAYEADLAKRKLADLAQIPLLRLSSYDPVTYCDYLNGYYIYASDTMTIAYLQSAGFDTDAFAFRLDPEAIEQIIVHDYSQPADLYAGDMKFAYTDSMAYSDENMVCYTREDDAETIARIAEVMVPQSFSYNNSVLHPMQPQIDLEVTYSGDMNNGIVSYFSLPYGCTY
ncbi:MAG: hypothetical protein J5518_00425 [Lachnospiraceae bacterium]|nr:hypothetical protein [Lachnospiraceae bacterium]